MKYTVDHDYHIHSELSSCSRNPEQTPRAILDYAVRNGYKRIVLTDHYWDKAVDGASNWYNPQDFDHISAALPLPQAEGVEFLFGCETEMDRYLTIGIPPERFDDFDFVVIPTTHMHMEGFTIPAESAHSPEDKARLWVDRLDALLHKPLPFHKIGIAHLACPLIMRNSRDDLYRIFDMIPQSDLERVFDRAAEVGVGIELNYGDFIPFDGGTNHVLRIFRIAKECGCKFYCASDAHGPKSLNEARAYLEKAVDVLGLTEEDNFHITKG
ncbi:MAG: hypothetical protein IJY04_10875 [Clostridia bacterium]|nr:hypothetical protein [Clostridia bacterium]